MKTLQLIHYLFQHPEILSVWFENSDDSLTQRQAIENLSAYWDVDNQTKWRINKVETELMIYYEY